MTEPTKLRLAKVLADAGFSDLSLRAEAGEFSDFESKHATPQIVLYHELASIGTEPARLICEQIRRGEWDDTKAEAEAWWEKEGKTLL